MTSQIYNELGNEVVEFRQPSLTFNASKDSIDGKIDNLESIKQSIEHILSTERYSNPIYSDAYGVELEQYLGKDYGYLVADIETTLNDALKQDDRIKNVIVDNIEKMELDSVKVEFTVYTIYGNVKEELNVLQ